MIGEEVLAFGINPKKKGKKSKARKGGFFLRTKGKARRAGRKVGGFFKRLIPAGTKGHIGCFGGLLAADPGVRKINGLIAKKDATGNIIKNTIEPGSMADAGASWGAAIAAAFLGRRFMGEEAGIGAYYGGVTVAIQKLLATGKPGEAPLGDKIAAGYGTRLRAAFAGIGAQDDIIFIPAGVSDIDYEDNDEGIGSDPSEE